MSVLSFDSAGAAPFSLMLERFQHHLGDASRAFETMADYQKSTVNARQFNARGTAETGKWSPLSRDYGRWKATVRPGRPLLVFDGDLKREMTVRGHGVDVVTPTSMTVGTDLSYARYHQQGTTRMPARRLIGAPRKEDTRMMAKILQRWIIDGQAVSA